jgi:hypothetical protein
VPLGISAKSDNNAKVVVKGSGRSVVPLESYAACKGTLPKTLRMQAAVKPAQNTADPAKMHAVR